MLPPSTPQQRKGPEQNVSPLAAADSTRRDKSSQPAPPPPTGPYSLQNRDRIDDGDIRRTMLMEAAARSARHGVKATLFRTLCIRVILFFQVENPPNPPPPSSCMFFFPLLPNRWNTCCLGSGVEHTNGGINQDALPSKAADRSRGRGYSQQVE